jgi:hypothetical protein
LAWRKEEQVRGRRRSARAARSALLAAVLVAGCALAYPVAAAGKEQPEDAAGFNAFSQRVEAFVRLHKSVEATLPKLKPTDLPEMITAHQRALERKIREARPGAQRGDIFTEQARKAFRRAVRSAFRGPDAPHAHATIQQGDPVEAVHLRVNQPYPEGVGYTTVPPTLLLKMPKLPEEAAYRIVDRDLVLLDVKANLVVDLIPEVVPIKH